MKIIFDLIVYLMIFCSIGFKYDALNNKNELEVSLNKKYQFIGTVNNYRLYKDTSITIFPQALEYIYEDKNYKYYFREIKSHIYILVNDVIKIGIKEGLQKGEVCIEDLYELIPIYKVAKNNN